MTNKKHNKKRNTAFLYQILLNEASEALYHDKDVDKYSKILSIIKNNFHGKSHLRKELQAYNSLKEAQKVNTSMARQIVEEVVQDYNKIDKKTLFEEQSKLIKQINVEIGQKCYKKHIKNYRNLANNFHLLNNLDEMSVHDRVALKETVARAISTKLEEQEYVQPVDSIEYVVLVRKFNEKYGTSLNERQKKFMKHFLTSFDNDASFKTYLNDEISSLKEEVQKSKEIPEIKNDPEMLEKANKIYNLLEEFKTKKYDNDMLQNVLKVQKLVEEIHNEDPE